jgi:hypothetical protein
MTADKLGHAITHDFINLFLGELIGAGMYREVYALRTDETKVIKIESFANNRFCNQLEWEIWNAAPLHVQRWFAPLVAISPCGTVMIQERVKPLNKTPMRVPSFLTDLKPSNWGLYKGRPVCVDFANNLFFDQEFRRMRLKKLNKRERAFS